jgi:hypothetical protein
VGVVEVLVLAQHDHQVPLIPHQGPVQQLAAAAADPPFHDRIHPRRLNPSTDYPGTSGTEDLIERGGEAGVPVMQDELHPRPDILQVHEQVPGLLDHPRLDRVPVAPKTRIRRVPCSITARTQTFVPSSSPAVKKSSARIPCAWDRRNSAQPGPSRRGAGSMPAFLRICQTVDGATVIPNPACSPWMQR